MGQSRADSLIESVVNTLVGFVLSMLAWVPVAWLLGLPNDVRTNLEVTLLFTVISVARQYALRRLFDGRTVYAALRGRT